MLPPVLRSALSRRMTCTGAPKGVPYVMAYVTLDPRRISMRSIKSLAALTGAALALGAGAGTTLAASENPQPSVWEHHQATTAWFGQTTHYTCPGLENTLRRILLYLG